MTYYFDRFGLDLAALEAEWKKGWAEPGILPNGFARKVQGALTDLERRIVEDVTIAAEWPDFPVDLRTKVHSVVLAHAVEMRPTYANTNYAVEEVGDVFRELQNLGADLHTVFHQVSERDVRPFSDDPRACIRTLYARGEQARENMAQEGAYPPRDASDE